MLIAVDGPAFAGESTPGEAAAPGVPGGLMLGGRMALVVFGLRRSTRAKRGLRKLDARQLRFGSGRSAAGTRTISFGINS